MSTSQPLPIQASVPAASTKAAPVSGQSESLDTESKGVFGGVLSDELESVNEESPVTALASDTPDAENPTRVSLPLDGNSLPQVINTQRQADIAELNIDSSEELLLAEEQSQLFGISLPLSEAPLKISLTGLADKDPVLSQQAAKPLVTDSVRIITGGTLQANKPETNNQAVSLLPFAEAGIDTETQAVAQFKETLQLQSLFSPVTRQTEAGIESLQIARVVDQFTELNAKPLTTPVTPTAVNPTPLSETSSLTTTTQLSIDVPIQDQRWQKAFSQRVVWSVGNVQSAQLRINPAELGRIDIQVNVEHDKANVVFATQHGAVKDVIEQALPRLRDMLADQGVELENIEIFQDNLNQQQADSHRGSPQQQETENQLWSSSNQDEPAEQTVLVSNVTFKEDVVDFYV